MHHVQGAGLYHSCHYCHSLKEGVHLTGPSLANLWGKPAGKVAGFGSYTDALKKSGLVWDEKTLTKWLENPQKLVPGTSMILRHKHSGENLQRLVAFLKVGMGPDGYNRAVNETGEAKVMGQLQADVSKPEKRDIVTELRHCDRTIELKFADGSTSKHWENNINLKSDSSPRGPPAGKPVKVEIGSLGDRAAIVFRSPSEYATFVKPCAK